MAVSSERQQQLQQHQIRLSCVVPVFNEAAGIRHFLRALYQTLITITDHIQIIMVDDGSEDNTVTLAEELITQLPLKIVCFSRNFGKEMALAAGLKEATGDVTLLIDADFQHPLDLLPQFFEKWAQGYDMVYGVQQCREHQKLPRRFFSQVFYQLMSRFSKIKLPANAGDFRLLDHVVVNALNQIPERNRFMKGLYCWVGFKSIAIPFTAVERTTGKSGWPLRKLTALAITGFISFSDIPLRIWGLIGLLISSISFAYGVYVILETWWYGVSVPGYATLVVAIMFFGGVQLLSIGILGEYIARIFNEVKQRPPYIIARYVGGEVIEANSQQTLK